MKDTWAIIVAGGIGNRFGAEEPKQFLSLGGRPLVEYSLDLFSSFRDLGGIVLVLPDPYVATWQQRLSNKGVRVTAGGTTRQQSVSRGLKVVPTETKYVAIHDAARPLVTPEIFKAALAGAREVGAAVTAIPLADTLKKGNETRRVIETISREDLYRIQTPQVFERHILEECLLWGEANGFDATDEATLVEKMGGEVQIVMGSEFNFKVTRPTDLTLAEALVGRQKNEEVPMEIRIGEGYDVHAFEAGRDLILGGVKVPFEKGLKGHSDADALLHAVADAILGAAAAGDLGAHFPDTDPQYRGASSLKLLETVRERVEKKGFFVKNVDATLICQRPKLAPHIPAMRENIARALKVDLDRVSVKATTEEGLGFTGNMEGLAARAVVLLQGRG